jgi:hypothetical protein
MYGNRSRKCIYFEGVLTTGMRTLFALLACRLGVYSMPEKNPAWGFKATFKESLDWTIGGMPTRIGQACFRPGPRDSMATVEGVSGTNQADLWNC